MTLWTEALEHYFGKNGKPINEKLALEVALQTSHPAALHMRDCQYLYFATHVDSWIDRMTLWRKGAEAGDPWCMFELVRNLDISLPEKYNWMWKRLEIMQSFREVSMHAYNDMNDRLRILVQAFSTCSSYAPSLYCVGKRVKADTVLIPLHCQYYTEFAKAFYGKIKTEREQAINALSIVGLYHGVVKDIRVLIGKLIFDSWPLK